MKKLFKFILIVIVLIVGIPIVYKGLERHNIISSGSSSDQTQPNDTPSTDENIYDDMIKIHFTSNQNDIVFYDIEVKYKPTDYVLFPSIEEYENGNKYIFDGWYNAAGEKINESIYICQLIDNEDVRDVTFEARFVDAVVVWMPLSIKDGCCYNEIEAFYIKEYGSFDSSFTKIRMSNLLEEYITYDEFKTLDKKFCFIKRSNNMVASTADLEYDVKSIKFNITIGDTLKYTVERLRPVGITSLYDSMNEIFSSLNIEGIEIPFDAVYSNDIKTKHYFSNDSTQKGTYAYAGITQSMLDRNKYFTVDISLSYLYFQSRSDNNSYYTILSKLGLEVDRFCEGGISTYLYNNNLVK